MCAKCAEDVAKAAPAVLATAPPVPQRRRLTGLELRATREYLGLSRERLALVLEVRADTVERWERGKADIPYGVGAELLHLRRVTAAAHDELLQCVRADKSAGLPAFVPVWPSDDSPGRYMPGGVDLGARWWR